MGWLEASGESEIVPVLGATEGILGRVLMLQKRRGGGRGKIKFQAQGKTLGSCRKARGMDSEPELMEKANCPADAEGMMQNLLRTRKLVIC